MLASQVASSRIEAVFRAERGRVVAVLARALGDLPAAEDALQEAFASALAHWPGEGIPKSPAAWLTTSARNAAISACRHERVARDKHELIARELDDLEMSDDADIPDERLRLIFTCCHPALAPENRVALTLHTLCGVPTPSIARLFFASEATIAQRIVRAKRKIKTSRIPYALPRDDELDERLETVLAVVYLLFTEGFAGSEADASMRLELCEEAIRLGRVIVHLCPAHAESRGLLALMILHHARRATRVDCDDDIVPLDEQDRSKWDVALVDEGTRELDVALAHGTPGPYQIQAAIAALHASARHADATDWAQISALYEELLKRQPSPSAALALSFAVGMAEGPEQGLARLDALREDDAFEDDGRAFATRAELLRRSGRRAEAARAYDHALARITHARERRFLARRAASCRNEPGPVG